MPVLPGSDLKRLVARIFKTILILSIFSLISSCGSSSNHDDSGLVTTLPESMMKVLSNGTLRATLEVYGPDGALEHSEDLQINPITGEVFSTQFQLQRGFTYSFLITFFYEPEGMPELPISFIAKSVEVIDDFFNLTWDSAEIIYAVSQISPDLSAAVSISSLPDIDADDDGYSNFYELREGSDPFDGNGIPQPPTMTVLSNASNHEDLVDLTLRFEDASGVSEIKPASPLCGYSVWEITSLDDEGKVKELHAVFNTHSLVSNSPMTLQISATDILGLGQTFSLGVSFSRTNTTDPKIVGPEIAILAPKEGTTVSDFISAVAIACDEDGIYSLKPDLEGSVDNDLTSERFAGSIATTQLGDGEQTLNFIAIDNNGDERTRGIQIIVADSQPIKIDSPLPGSNIKDDLVINAHVDKNLMPDVASLFIDSITSSAVSPGAEDHAFNGLRNNTKNVAESFTGLLDTSFEAHEREFTVAFKAVGSTSNAVTRQVTYKINNDPDINFWVENGDSFFGCISGGTINLKWQVTNRESNDLITFGSEDVRNSSGISNKLINCDSLPDGKTNFSLRAVRENTRHQIFDTSTTLSLTKITIQDLVSGQLINPDDLSFILAGADDQMHWSIEFQDKDGILVSERTGSGSEVNLINIGLEPRSDYYITIRIINQLGQTISQSTPIPIITSDDNLIGWWRFNEGRGSTVFDYSGFNQNLTLTGNYQWLGDPLGGINIFGTNSYASKTSANTHGAPNGITIEVFTKLNVVDPSNSTAPLYKPGEYFISDPINGNYFRARFNLTADCNTPTTDWPFVDSTIPVDTSPHHLVATYNGIKMMFYVDGHLASSKNVTGALLNNCTDPLYFRFGPASTNIFEGAIYNRALTSTEVMANYNRVISE